MNKYRKLSWSTFSTMAGVGTSFLFNKLFAVYFGPPGIALLAHLQNLQSILISIPLEGINRGLVKNLAGTDQHSEVYKKYFSAAVLLLAFTFIVSLPGLFYLLSRSKDLPAFLDNTSYFWYAAIALLFHMIFLLFISLLQAKLYLKAYAILSVVNNVAGIALVFSGLSKGLYFGSLFLLFSPSAGLPVLLYYFYTSGQFPRFSRYFNIKHLKDVCAFMVVSLSVLLLGRMVDYFVRIYIIKNYTLELTGLWQAAVKISDGYSTLLMGVLNLTFFPKLSQLHNSKVYLGHFLFDFWKKFTLAVTLFLLAAYVLKRYLILLLFDDAFLEAAFYLKYQVAGDLFKFISWIPIFVLLAQGKIKTYIFLQFISAAIYILLLFVCTSKTGIAGVAYAHVFRYILFLLAVIIIFRNNDAAQGKNYYLS